MPRPPLGPIAMTHTVKFRLREDEWQTLQKIARGGSVSEAIRRLIADESDRMRHPKK